MRSLFLAAAGIGLAFALPAAAAQPASSASPGTNATTSSQPGTASQNEMMTQQRLKSDLEQAGFRDVKVMPQSFLAQATDKQGRTVTMMVSPNSFTEVTQLGNAGPNGSSGAGATTPGHSASGNGTTGTGNSTGH